MLNVPELTIVTVAGPQDEPYIAENIKLIAALNPNATYRMHVIDNGRMISSELGISGTLPAEIHSGVSQNPNIPSHLRGSYQHAEALNQFFREQSITTPYVLILDPDYYIIAPNWIHVVLEMMRRENHAFFGAPWHPQWFTKYRYFPCVHCLFVDCSQVDTQELDFTPDLIASSPTPPTQSDKKNQSLLRILFQFFTARRHIMQSFDTGYAIYKTHYNKKHFGLLKPVSDYSRVALPHLRYRFGRLLEWLFPERFSFIPKKCGYAEDCGFVAHNMPDTRTHGWEEFMFQGKPFGFHMRRFTKGKRDIPEEIILLQTILADCLKPSTSDQ